MPTDTARGRTDAVKFALRARGVEPRLLRPAPSELDRSARRAAVHPGAGSCGGGTVRPAGAAGRGHAGVQRGRRAGAVPRRRPRLPGDVASAPGRRWRRRRADPRPQHRADRHARTGGRIAGMVQRAPRLRLACRCSRSRSPDTCSPGCASRIAGRRWQTKAVAVALDVRFRASARNRRDDSSCSPLAFLLLFVGRLAALSRECRRPRAGRLHRPRGRGDPRRRRRQRARGGQRALDAARRLPRHAGMHFDAADSGLSGSRLCLLDDMAAADPGRPRRRAALHRPRHRAAPRRGPPRRRGGLAVVPGARLLSVAPRRGGRVPRRAVAPRRPRGAAARPGRRHRGRRVRLPPRPVLHARRHLSGRSRRSTIRRERSRSFLRSRSASISRCGSRRSSRSAGSASSPGSRSSGSRRRQACSRCTPSPATPA